jgi:hypothetical protein
MNTKHRPNGTYRKSNRIQVDPIRMCNLFVPRTDTALFHHLSYEFNVLNLEWHRSDPVEFEIPSDLIENPIKFVQIRLYKIRTDYALYSYWIQTDSIVFKYILNLDLIQDEINLKKFKDGSYRRMY